MSNEISLRNEQLPAFIDQENAGEGLDTIQKHLRPQRVKTVERTATEPYDQHPTGSLILVPNNLLFCSPGEVFHFVPILFFTDYLKCNPMGIEPFILDRSRDENSEIARCATNPDLWKEEHPSSTPQNPKFIRYQENLNFIVAPVNSPEWEDELIVLSLARARHGDGQKLLSLMNQRRKRGAPIYANVFEAKATKRTNSEGEWFGFDFSNPSGDSGVRPFVEDEVRYQAFQQLHRDLKEKSDFIEVPDDYEEKSTVDEAGM